MLQFPCLSRLVRSLRSPIRWWLHNVMLGVGGKWWFQSESDDLCCFFRFLLFFLSLVLCFPLFLCLWLFLGENEMVQWLMLGKQVTVDPFFQLSHPVFCHNLIFGCVMVTGKKQHLLFMFAFPWGFLSSFLGLGFIITWKSREEWFCKHHHVQAELQHWLFIQNRTYHIIMQIPEAFHHKHFHHNQISN